MGRNVLGWVVGLGARVEGDDMVEDLVDNCGDGPRTSESLDLEGPSFATTTPRLSKNFLNSYLATESPSEHQQLGRCSRIMFTSNVLLEVTITFLFDHVRRRRVPGFIGIKDRI